MSIFRYTALAAILGPSHEVTPDAVAKSVRVQASCAEGREFETYPFQTNGLFQTQQNVWYPWPTWLNEAFRLTLVEYLNVNITSRVLKILHQILLPKGCVVGIILIFAWLYTVYFYLSATSGPQLVHQRLWYVTSSLCESAYKRPLAAYW